MTTLACNDLLDLLCPMHLRVSETGHILYAGPTARKLGEGGDLCGSRFLEVFSVKRPQGVTLMADLLASGEVTLHLETRNRHRTSLKGLLFRPKGPGHEVIINLGFGISVMDAVSDYHLTNGDFAATDLAMEMLFLVEAKNAAMEASHRLNERLQGAKIAAEAKAFTDTLTGLGNRRALDAVLSRLTRAKAPFAVMQIDLDFFKQVNDTHGHAAGDYVLRQAAEVMREEVRAGDSIARVGGDEFTLVLPDVRDEEVLLKIGRRIIERLEKPISFEGQACRISASIGTVWIDAGRSVTAQEVLSDADLALYASKRAGRARQTFFEPALRAAANEPAAPLGQGAAQR